MLDRDLAELYGVEIKRLNEQVKRNIESFPEDFMFQLTKEEYLSLRSHFATLKRGAHRKYYPYVFTEHGILMLSSVLKSSKARQVNIQIMRTFVKIRKVLTSNEALRKQFEKLEKKVTSKVSDQDKQIQLIFDTVKQLLELPAKETKRIGFVVGEGQK